MTNLIPLLREALTAGAVLVDLGRVAGHCGYLDVTNRHSSLNPDASDDEWLAELTDQLRALTPRHGHEGQVDEHTPVPARPCLVHSTDEPENPIPHPRRPGENTPDLRVAE